MDTIKFHGLESLFDPQLISEIVPELSRTKTTSTFEDISNIVGELNHSLNRLNMTLHFSVDNESDTYYVAVSDTRTNEMLRRFPIDEMQILYYL